MYLVSVFVKLKVSAKEMDGKAKKRERVRCQGILKDQPGRVLDVFINDHEKCEELLKLPSGSFFAATQATATESVVSVNRDSKVSDDDHIVKHEFDQSIQS